MKRISTAFAVLAVFIFFGAAMADTGVGVIVVPSQVVAWVSTGENGIQMADSIYTRSRTDGDVVEYIHPVPITEYIQAEAGTNCYPTDSWFDGKRNMFVSYECVSEVSATTAPKRKLKNSKH